MTIVVDRRSNYAISGKRKILVKIHTKKKAFKAFKLSSFCLHHRTLKFRSRKLSQEEEKNMTTNTKAITECSSCCWIIYCKYLFHFDSKQCEEVSKMLLGASGRGAWENANVWETISGPCPWRQKEKCLQFFSCDSSSQSRRVFCCFSWKWDGKLEWLRVRSSACFHFSLVYDYKQCDRCRWFKGQFFLFLSDLQPRIKVWQ